MVRRCPVSNCMESDQTILAHRFPKIADMASKWQDALNLQKYSIDDLQKKYVVCTRHFMACSYRNEISNSLNTTAVPNLEIDPENDRIHLTNPSLRNKQKIPVRCHKLPSHNKSQIIDIQVARVKRPRLELKESDSLNIFDDCFKVIKNESFTAEIVPLGEEEAETFEICEYTDDEVNAESQEETEDEVHHEPLKETIPKVTLDERAPSKLFEEILHCHQETQTDLVEQTQQEPIVDVKPQESKDDKIISILYPEFKDMDKIHLIEKLNESNRKIESLEDKVKKLELAMRNLL